ncbi:DNA polymerase III subunit gamma/tau [Breznakiella homolactica]|uniref:DNA polymerase III subunit gamma/tau n=1 Tax=Breznakiella homolactica TaxID=2798577 RepID=A0A7T7XNZ9_9SPIR|nr:DNA polymerase III subunit gamma/tau [Breznakiella homolactica]QQO09748.1 DNA polymerase III subunit gamma/tau [Breznakiella homolactica]
MAYEVTATRRRPKTFDELAGQDFVVATLKSSIETGQIAHAYLFSGPRGCGKTSAARILARSLNCEKGPTAVPCGECANCREISRGASMDIIEIDGASNTSVNDVRQIKDEVLFPPNSGRYKIYIIDEVHMLSNSAFNALLKTIEEPPPYIVFIFATTELHKVPATIKSRCQQFAFRLIPIETISGILRATCDEMNIQAEDEALFWIAKESTGSLRDAYTLFDQVASFSDGHIRAQLIREKLGLIGLDTMNALAEACAASDTAAAFGLIDSILESGVAIEQFVIDLATYYRSILLLKNGITRESLLGYTPDRFSAAVTGALDSIHIERAVSLLLDLYRDIRYSVSPRFELETAVSKLCWLGKWISPAEMGQAISAIKNGAFSAGIPGPGSHGSGGAEKKSPPQGGIAHPLADAGGAPPPADTSFFEDREPGGAPEGINLSEPGAFTEGFKRFLAAKEAGTPLSGGIAPEESPEHVFPGEDLPEEEAGAATDHGTAEEDDSAAADPPGEDLSRIREEVIQKLNRDRGMLASALTKSLAWEWDGEKLTIAVQDPLTAELIKKDSTVIRDLLGEYGVRVGNFTVTERSGPPPGPDAAVQGTAPQLEIVRQIFRGTIVKDH